jgi:hypothetical protein
VLILFPDLTPARPSLIDKVQASLKPEFVANGLMIGQFHSDCSEPAIWNRHFHPLRSPVPLLAIRYMVATDFPFLNQSCTWTGHYLRRFGREVPSRLETTVREAALRFGLDYPPAETPGAATRPTDDQGNE